MLASPAALRASLARRPVPTTTAVAGLLVLGFVLLRLAFAASLGGFVVASDDYVDPARTPDRLPVVTSTGGYDGQFVYRFAVDPWTSQPTEHGVELDNPAYRHQRIATPVLAWTVALLPGVSTLLALVAVNAVALVVAAWYASRLATAAGRHPLWGLVLAFPACMPISLGRDLTEPVAWAAVLAGLWYARQRRWAAAAVALTLGVLARETTLVVVAGLAIGEAVRIARAIAARPRHPTGVGVTGLNGPRDPEPVVAVAAPAARTGRSASSVADEPAAGVDVGPAGHAPGGAASGRVSGSTWWLVVPIAAGAAWQVVLWQLWGSVPVRSGGTGSLGGLPLLGVFGSLVADLPDFTSEVIGNPAVGAVVFVERFALLALFGYAGVTLLRRRGGCSTGEAVAWVLAVALALSLRAWRTDVQFLRAANEAVGLSLLVAIGDGSRAGRLARWLGAALVAGVALEYAIRQ